MSNSNPTTGIRYGVISAHSLNQDFVNDLFMNGTNVSYEAAVKDATAECLAKWEHAAEDADLAAAEVDNNMHLPDREAFMLAHIQKALNTEEESAEEYADAIMDNFGDTCQIDEPTYEGTNDGVKWGLSTLGGAYLLWVFEGPVGRARSLCSPCVPNAADLNNGFVIDEGSVVCWMGTHPNGADTDFTYPCYVVPKDWLPKTED